MKDLILDYYPGRPDVIKMVLIKGRKEGQSQRRWYDHGGRRKEGAKEWGQPLETGEGKETDCPLEPPEGISPADILTLA